MPNGIGWNSGSNYPQNQHRCYEWRYDGAEVGKTYYFKIDLSGTLYNLTNVGYQHIAASQYNSAVAWQNELFEVQGTAFGTNSAVMEGSFVYTGDNGVLFIIIGMKTSGNAARGTWFGDTRSFQVWTED